LQNNYSSHPDSHFGTSVIRAKFRTNGGNRMPKVVSRNFILFSLKQNLLKQ
jgi:hypothetical protein